MGHIADFLKIYLPQISGSTKDLYEPNEILPQGFNPLTNAAENPLNSADLYDEINKKLSEAAENVVFDVDQGKALLAEI